MKHITMYSTPRPNKRQFAEFWPKKEGKMTPQEIDDYKRVWRMGSYFERHTHSDLRNDCKEWCKENCETHQWDMKIFTDIYGDTVRFELESHLVEFDKWYKHLLYSWCVV